jgi:hypothetical protein
MGAHLRMGCGGPRDMTNDGCVCLDGHTRFTKGCDESIECDDS